MNQILDNLRSLGTRRLAMLGGAGLGIVAALVFGLSLLTAPDYTVLYSQLSPASAASMVDALDKAGIESKVSTDGASVSVPRPDVARARMALAEKGLPSDGEPGWELFDNSTGLGMNSFMQHINRLRAMEGELSRSIQTLDGIQSARVHLVLPEREAFSRSAPDPSASVIVRAAANHTVSRRQALAIRNLIATAVANMSPGRVTVLSARGDTILAEDGTGEDGVSLDGSKSALEDRMARNIEQILSARVGAGNARVQVSVSLDHSRNVTVSQSYNPDQQVVRSTSTSQSKAQDSKADGQVGVGANLPPALQGPQGQQPANSNASSKTNEQTTYEIGSTRSQTTTEAGAIKRISVAVLVNGIYDVGKDGAVTYKERPPEEVKRLQSLVESAIGYDAKRGDTVSVDSLRFMDYSMDVGEPVGPTLMQRLSNNAVAILRWLVGLAVVALALIFGVRPMLARLGKAEEAAAEEAPATLEPGAPPAQLPAAPARPGGLPAAPRPEPVQPSATVAAARTRPAPAPPALDAYDPEEDEFMGALTIHGGKLKRRVDAIRRFVDDDPNEAMKILRSWLAEEAPAK
ncbi:flagellar basal-body MS-ring/collar protein FliF [Acidimangrovimonas sediminis]|uniref:flagellar basal-body MS-ring/collar protein FliF n=1 Tax=Acidimangrovimonas sediminis TaxID=2056283 RepID=UPI000C809A00|nr:flagellar basal-body MS-ring/collar protein FliF [Acidimangrovimonas sediminis]